MKKLIALTAIMILACTGCVMEKITENTIEDNAVVSQIEIVEEKKDEALVILESMTLEEKLGQMIIIGFNGIKPDDTVIKIIQENHAGGVILFSRNIENSEQLTGLINELKDINSVNKLPLFISVDQEGGRVNRLPEGSKNFPSGKTLGRKNNRELSFKTGQDIGEALLSFGFNMDFAPVMDILSNPKNTVIGDRAFGSTPDIVSSLAVEIMKGLQSKNVISVIKHFPGHGDTSVDSHAKLPVVNHDITRLYDFELIPFKEAIENGADVIMAAHIKFPKIDDSGKPATLSGKMLTDILRGDLEFTGVIITDDMEMGAISKNYSVEESSVDTVKAGADIILMCHSYEKQKTALEALKAAVENGEISIERIDESVDRIIRLKQKYLGIHLSL